MKEFLASENDAVNTSRCVVRVKTSTWADNKGLHTKKSLIFLRRHCKEWNILEEDINNIGADSVLPNILNLGSCEDGVYEVVTCNEERDWELGYIEDYDYKLIAYSIS